MDAHADHYAELLISAKAGHIGSDVTPDAFANAVWSFARALAARRAQLAVEDIEELRKSHKIPASVPTEPPGEQLSPAQGSPISAGQTSGEVIDEELAPFLDATKELRGHPVDAGPCAGGDPGAEECVQSAVERVDHVLVCFNHAREEFACIALDEGIDAARVESANFSTEEVKHAAAERGTSGALLRQEPAGRTADGSGGHEGERGRDGGPERAPDDTHLREHGRPGRNDADRGNLDVAAVRPVEGSAAIAADVQHAAAAPEGPGDVAIRGPEAPSEASRGGIAPAAPEDGAQPQVEVAGHAADPVAQEAPSVQPVQEVHHEVAGQQKDTSLSDCSAPGAPGSSGTAPQSAGEELHEFYVERAANARGHLLRDETDAAKELLVRGERIGSTAQKAAESATVAVNKMEADLGLEQTAPPQSGKRGRKTKRESVPRKAKALTCGGTKCSETEGMITHHVGDPTCSQYGPREEVTPRPVAMKRASELAAKFEGTP